MTRLLALSLAFLAGCTSLEERQDHMQGQIQMIQVQKDAEEEAEDVTCVPTFEGYQCSGG